MILRLAAILGTVMLVTAVVCGTGLGRETSYFELKRGCFYVEIIGFSLTFSRKRAMICEVFVADLLYSCVIVY